MDDKLTVILSELDEIKRLVSRGLLSNYAQSIVQSSATWRINATDEEAKEFSRKKAIARRRAKR
jgi:hypothetical protein